MGQRMEQRKNYKVQLANLQVTSTIVQQHDWRTQAETRRPQYGCSDVKIHA